MTRAQLNALPVEISRPLLQLDRTVRVLTILRGCALLAILLVVGVGTGLLLDLWLDLGTQVRVGLLAGLALVLGATLVWMVIRPLFWRTSPAEMAALVETAHPELHERLTSTVELLRPDIPEAHKGSPLMRELLTRQTVQSVRAADLTDAVDGARTQRTAWLAVVSLFLMILPLFYSRDGYLLLLTRFFAPWKNLERASNLYFEIENGDRTVARGSDVTLTAQPRWRLREDELPRDVWLHWSNTGGETDSRRMLWDPDRKLFTATLPHVFHPFDFDVSSGTARTRTYHVNVVEPPAVDAFLVDVQPPPYTGQPAQRLDGAVGETTVFERSQVRFELHFNKPIKQAEIVWYADAAAAPARAPQPVGRATLPAGAASSQPLNAGAAGAADPVRAVVPLELSADRTQGLLRFEALPDAGGRFAVRLTDEHGLTNAGDPLRALRIQLDQPPTIAFADQVDQPEARPDDILTLPVRATDDVGVDVLELHYQVIPQGGRNVVTAEGTLLGTREVDYSFRLDLARLTTDLGEPIPLRNNDRVRVTARAADERPLPGPNESWTEPRTITIRDDAPPYSYEALAQTREQWRQMLQSIRKELEQNRQQVRGLEQEAQNDLNQKLNFEQNDAIPPLAAHQREQATRLEQLAALFGQSPLFANLTATTQAVAREELTAAPAALDAAVPAELPQKQERLQESAAQVEAALARLERLEKQFEAIAELERELSEVQRLAEHAERLAEDALALERERQNPPENLAPERQQARDAALEMARQVLQQEHQALTQDLTNLLERSPEILNAARQQEFDRLRELARQALELAAPQDRLAEALQAEARDQAAALGDVAARQQELLEAAAELAGATAPHQSQQLVEPLNLDELRAALRELQQGNAAAAAQQQEAAADELARLAEELARNERLPSDPQAAAHELAAREQALREQIEPVAAAARQAEEALRQDPLNAEARQQAEQARRQLRELAAAQTAIQAAAAHLRVPRNDQERQRSAVERAYETTQRLLDEQPQRAVESAEQTRKALEALANEIGDPARRQRDARRDVEQLRGEQEQFAREAADIRNRARQGQAEEQTRQQLDQLAQREQALARQLAEVDVPEPFAAQQQQALRQAARAMTDLTQPSAEDAPASTRHMAQALADLEQALDNKPTAPERLAELVPQEQQLAEQVAAAPEESRRDALRQAAGQQREMARQVSQLRTPLSEPLRDDAQRQLEEAARAAEEAARDAQRFPDADREITEARQALERLAAAVAPPTGSPQEQVAALAQAQQQAAAQAQQQASQAAVPSPQAMREAQAGLQQRTDALENLRTGPEVQQPRREAAQALAAARDAQTRAEELTRRETPADGTPAAPSEELAQALRQNAEAQQRAAETLQRLQQQLLEEPAQQRLAQQQASAEQQLAQTLAPHAEPLDQLTQRAAELADRQAGLRQQTEELDRQQAEAAAEAAAPPPAGDLSPEQLAQQQREREQRAAQRRQQNEQRASELRQQQEQLAGDIRQLPHAAPSLAAAEAREQAEDAREALARNNAAEAAAAQRAAEEALRELSAAARGQLAEQRQQAAAQAAALMAGTPPPAPNASPGPETPSTPQVAGNEPPASATPEAAPQPAAPENNAPAQQLAQRAEALAEAQRQLAAAIRAEQQQRLAAAPPASPQSNAPAATAPATPAESPATPAESPTAPASPAAESPATAAAPATPRAESGATPAPTPGQSSPASAAAPMDSPAARQAAEAIAAQNQLAREAADLAVQTARQTGPESPPAASALEFARQATAAAEAAASGDLMEAGNVGQQAAQVGEQAAQQLTAAGEETPEAALGQQASGLAERQQQLAQQMQQLAQSPAANRLARSQAQQRTARQTEQLAQQFEAVAQNLAAQPLDRPQQGAQASAAQQFSQQAAGAIESSAGELSQGNPQQASAQAAAGAEQLRAAAEQALQAAGEMPAQPSQVPGEVGQQLAQALQQLQQAGQQLAAGQPPGAQPAPASPSPPGQASPAEGQPALGQPPAGELAQAPPNAAGQPMPAGGEPGQPGEPMSGSGEPTPGEGQPTGQSQPAMPAPSPATSSLQQVAQSLNQAAQQLGLTPGQAQQGASSQSAAANAQGNPAPEGESSDFGARETVRLTDLEVQLRNISARNWGELPGQLQTEILESARRRGGGDYGKVIQRYFEEVSRARVAAPAATQP